MRLVDLARKIVSGQIISRVEAKEEVGDEVVDVRNIIVPKAIAAGRITHSDLVEVKFKKAVDTDRITKEGDIVLKLSTPYDAAYITNEDEGLVVTSFCVIIRGLDINVYNSQFLTAYINTEYIRQILKSKVAGTTMPLIKLSDVKELELPDVDYVTQCKLGDAYNVSCKKQDVLKELLENEQKIMENVILQVVREAL